MVDTDDVQGYRRKYENQLNRLENADIDENDREQIWKFVVHLRTNDSDVDSLGTVVGHLNRIRLTAERAHMPLTAMDEIDDVNALKIHLKDEHGLSEGTIRNYMKGIRKFFIWRDVDWGTEISIGPPVRRKHDPDEEISPDELERLLDACTNPRDRALIALLDDTGLRIGAILSFQIRHVSFDKRRSTLTINDSANVKGDDGPKALTWSRSYISNWLSEHPRPDDPDAALIHKLRGWDENEHGALAQQYAGRIVTKIAERAGLDGERVMARLFRSTAVSRWIREDMNEQAIKHRTGWTKDSRMFSVYSRVTDEEMNDLVFDHYDIDPEKQAERRALDKCPSCRSALQGHETFCPACAHPLTDTVASTVSDVDDDVFASMSNADAGGHETDLFTEFRRRFNADADFRARVVGEGDDSAHEESS